MPRCRMPSGVAQVSFVCEVQQNGNLPVARYNATVPETVGLDLRFAPTGIILVVEAVREGGIVRERGLDILPRDRITSVCGVVGTSEVMEDGYGFFDDRKRVTI
mmetsp:Transcript_28623/g.82820  ORF Transcript_28623/g.82820 Transcript_28623/m.82820 type:complete len:104 (-) Transcript_28623:130-441(-)